MELQKEM
jgi:hypothetical protein